MFFGDLVIRSHSQTVLQRGRQMDTAGNDDDGDDDERQRQPKTININFNPSATRFLSRVVSHSLAISCPCSMEILCSRT